MYHIHAKSINCLTRYVIAENATNENFSLNTILLFQNFPCLMIVEKDTTNHFSKQLA